MRTNHLNSRLARVIDDMWPMRAFLSAFAEAASQLIRIPSRNYDSRSIRFSVRGGERLDGEWEGPKGCCDRKTFRKTIHGALERH